MGCFAVRGTSKLVESTGLPATGKLKHSFMRGKLQHGISLAIAHQRLLFLFLFPWFQLFLYILRLGRFWSVHWPLVVGQELGSWVPGERCWSKYLVMPLGNFSRNEWIICLRIQRDLTQMKRSKGHQWGGSGWLPAFPVLVSLECMSSRILALSEIRCFRTGSRQLPSYSTCHWKRVQYSPECQGRWDRRNRRRCAEAVAVCLACLPEY